MKLFDRFRRKKAASSTPPRASTTTYDLTDPELVKFMRGGIASASGVAITPESSLRVSTAYRCTALISDHIATIPVDLKRRIDDRTQEDAADSSPVWALLRIKPNVWQTPLDFKRIMQAMVLLRGNGYALIIRSGGQIKQLVPLVGNMQITQNDDFTLRYDYTSLITGNDASFNQGEIFHLRGMSLDGIRGLSVIGHARETLGLSLITERHANKMFRNRTSAGGTLSHPKRIDDVVVERLKSQLEEFRGSDNESVYKDLILEEGMEYKRIDMTSVDAQFIQQREFSQHEVAMFFGVPPHRLGITTKQTSFGAGIEQQNISFVQDTLVPWTTMWEEAIKRDLIPSTEPKLFARFNFKELMRGDHAARSAFYTVMFNAGAMSSNDIRENEDMNPRDGGDEYVVGGLGGAAGGGAKDTGTPPAKA